MSERPAISLKGIGKRYTLYSSPLAGACDALGLGWLLPRRHQPSRHFWALRNIDLTLPRGARIGIIGRNGAGKSTLLKLITRNVDPTEGEIEVNGEVQALLQAGTGMHPEFTGNQNIEAALTYQGLTGAEIRNAVADIEEFTELGPFLGQPFKTYSTGMQARLAFATATVVKPDILIVDEVLGVGDGYFLSKSTERMRTLIDSGASVLLVSHGMDQIVRFCDHAVWMDRGQIVRQGDALEVVKEYERYLRLLDERRLKAKNLQRQAGAGGAVEPDGDAQFTDALTVRFRVPETARLRVGEVALLENDRQQDRLHVGGPQDSTSGNSAMLRVETVDAWSAPQANAGRLYRELDGFHKDGHGEIVFSLYVYDASVTYAFEIEYCLEGTSATVEVCRGGDVLQSAQLAPTADWQRSRVACEGQDRPGENGTPEPTLKMQHWPGLGGLVIGKMRLLDGTGHETVLFAFGSPMTLEIQFRADEGGTFPFQPALTIYRRADGVCISQHIGLREELTMAADEIATACLRLGPLQLSNDTYVFSIGLFRQFDGSSTPERYDLVDRSVEFKVYGRESHRRGVFQHPGEWTVERSVPAVALKSA